jgi:hypothetical protein
MAPNSFLPQNRNLLLHGYGLFAPATSKAAFSFERRRHNITLIAPAMRHVVGRD